MKLKKEFIKGNKKVANQIIADVKAEKISKSYAIECLVYCGLELNEIKEALGIIYNFVYNVTSKKFDKTMFEDIKNKGNKINYFNK